MNMEDIYYEHPELESEMEKHARDLQTRLRCIPQFVRDTFEDEPTADAFERQEFEEREPAFGWTSTQIDELEQMAAIDDIHEYILFHRIRRMMLRRLVSTSGAATVKDLCEILRKEAEANIPAPVPSWYKFSDARWGHDFDGDKGRRFGYAKCENDTCTATENLDTQFQQCARCKMACYCCRDCQVVDWKARHKIVCKKAAKQAETTAKAASFLEMFAKSQGN